MTSEKGAQPSKAGGPKLDYINVERDDHGMVCVELLIWKL